MRKSEKIWLVLVRRAGDSVNAVAYDNETDAENYASEMNVNKNEEDRIKVIETVLNRREEIPYDDASWGGLRIDIKSEFVEGLMEDMAPTAQILPGAAERFVSEKIDKVRKRAESRLNEIVKSETKEELLQTYEEWIRGKGMEKKKKKRDDKGLQLRQTVVAQEGDQKIA
jgi:hypothetical protein